MEDPTRWMREQLDIKQAYLEDTITESLEAAKVSAFITKLHERRKETGYYEGRLVNELFEDIKVDYK